MKLKLFLLNESENSTKQIGKIQMTNGEFSFWCHTREDAEKLANKVNGTIRTNRSREYQFIVEI